MPPLLLSFSLGDSNPHSKPTYSKEAISKLRLQWWSRRPCLSQSPLPSLPKPHSSIKIVHMISSSSIRANFRLHAKVAGERASLLFAECE